MTFLASWRLVFLVAPLALLAAYFAAAAFLLALVIFVFAFAQPARLVRTPKERATVVLTLDTSGSMVATDISPDRLAAAQQAARNFVQALPRGIQVGLVSFSTGANVAVAPTSDRATLLAAIDHLQAGGGTATASAINLSLQAIRSVPAAQGNKKAPGTIVLMSDGSPTIGENGVSPQASITSEAGAAKAAGIKINTIAFGTANGTVTINGETIPVPADPAAMAQIASKTGGRTFSAQSASQLKSVYNEIGRAVGYDVHHRDVTAWFIAIALVMLVAAAVGALIWSQRLV
jgi:Ca-activated chloride channel family protein